MFSIAVPLYDTTGRPGTFDVLLCILGNTQIYPVYNKKHMGEVKTYVTTTLM